MKTNTSAAEAVRLTRLQLENVRSIPKLDIELDRLTIVAGENGVGKSTILMAIEDVLNGGWNPRLIRTGAEEAVIRLFISTGHQIQKTIWPEGAPKKYELRITDADGFKVDAGQTWLSGLFDAITKDPLSLLDLKPHERGAALLEGMPATVDRKELSAAVAGAIKLPEGAELGHALQAIARVRKMIFDRRTDVGRDARREKATADELKTTLPDDDSTPDEIRSMRDSSAKRLEGMKAERQKAEDAIRASHKQTLNDAAMARMKAEREAEAARDKAIAEAQRAFDQAKNEALQIEHDVHSKSIQERDEQLQALASETEAIATVEAEIAELDRDLEAAIKAQSTRDLVESRKASAKALQDQYSELSEALKRMDALRNEVLSRMDLGDGVEVGEDGEIYVDGIPLPEQNTQTQYAVCLRIGARRAGRFGLALIDRGESVVGKRWDEFLAYAKTDPNVNLIVTRAEAGQPLHTKTA